MQTQTIQTLENNQTQFNHQQLNNSTIDTIKEIERVLFFWNNKLNLDLDFSNLTITISELHKNTLGHFANINTDKAFINTTQKLNVICLNAIHLKRKPYTTIIHELAHYINYLNGVKDCSSNQYHNKHFKTMAEKLLLNVEKTKHGFNHTTDTPGFLKLLDELKPSNNAFHISQIEREPKNKKQRLYRFVCECGYIIRCGYEDLNATCDNCNTQFKQED